MQTTPCSNGERALDLLRKTKYGYVAGLISCAPVSITHRAMMIASNPCSVETLARCFLFPEEIPPAFRVGTCREERLYLLDGQILPWEGTLAEVSSPICLRQADGTLRRPIIAVYSIPRNREL